MSTSTINARPVNQNYANLEVRIKKAEHAVWVRVRPGAGLA